MDEIVNLLFELSVYVVEDVGFMWDFLVFVILFVGMFFLEILLGDFGKFFEEMLDDLMMLVLFS